MKNLVKLSYLILFSIAISCTQDSTLDMENLNGVSAKANVKSTIDIIDGVAFFSGETPVIFGTSTLHRSKNGITVNFKAEDVIPGAYTIWWVIWNYPEECDGGPGACGSDADFEVHPDDVGVDVLYAGGHVVGNNGKANISGHLKAGDTSGTIWGRPEMEELGLLVGNTFNAEVHVVLRSHGPAVPGMVNEQISSYGGGCETNLAPFSDYPDELGECGDIAFSIHPPGM
jgi:hypothetical protein